MLGPLPVRGGGLGEGSLAEIYYRRSRFSTRLPSDRLYTPAHFWVQEHTPGTWRVGFPDPEVI